MYKNTIVKLLIFLLINFTGLYLGSLYTSKAAMAVWYQNLIKSPITPPGWIFGFAWTTIMLFFAVFMTRAYLLVQNKQKLIKLFSIQWVLNLIWNPVFFYMHSVVFGLVIIVALTLIVIIIIIIYRKTLKYYSLLMLPYIFWLFIACYLNFYILIKN